MKLFKACNFKDVSVVNMEISHEILQLHNSTSSVRNDILYFPSHNEQPGV